MPNIGLGFLLFLALISTFVLAYFKVARITRSPWNTDFVVLLPLIVVAALAIASYVIFFCSLAIATSKIFCFFGFSL